MDGKDERDEDLGMARDGMGWKGTGQDIMYASTAQTSSNSFRRALPSET